MSDIPDPQAVDAEARKLAGLQAQVESARAVLIRLLQDVVEAEARVGTSQAAQLAEANGQLIASALRSQAEADAAGQALREASRLAELDALTGLPNRVLLLDRLGAAMAQAKRHGGRLALLFLDLDNFKAINDGLGHAVGDEVLRWVAGRLAASIRAVDTVSRHGGDEFLILLGEVAQASDAVLIADKIIVALGLPTRFGDHVMRLTASIGISIYPDDGTDADALIKGADAAMYHAKRHEAGSLAFHGETPAAPRAVTSSPLVALRSPVTRYELALAEHDRQHAELREANENLVVAALGAQELQAAAERASRRQAEFMAVVADELSNPLAPIRLAAAMLGRQQSAEPLLPRAQAIIEQQVQTMLSLVGTLRDVSQIHTGTLTLSQKAVDLVAAIDGAVAACRPAMDTRLQRFDVRLPVRRIEILGDLPRLQQVISNLLDNASKFTPDHGLIELAVVVAADSVVLTISDSGIGISAQALPTVFEPFMQDVHAIGFNGVGLGIGLTVVHALVQAHGGRVSAHSRGIHLGSQFVVTLPLSLPHRSAEAGLSGQSNRSEAA